MDMTIERNAHERVTREFVEDKAKARKEYLRHQMRLIDAVTMLHRDGLIADDAARHALELMA